MFEEVDINDMKIDSDQQYDGAAGTAISFSLIGKMRENTKKKKICICQHRSFICFFAFLLSLNGEKKEGQEKHLVLLGGESRLDTVGKKTHLLHLGNTTLATDGGKNLLGLAEVDNIDGAAETVLHILDHAADVGDMRALVIDGLIGLILTSERTSETDHTGVLALGLDREHNSGGELIVSSALAVINLDNVDGIPSTLHGLTLLRLILGLLEEDASGKTIVKVPAVNGGDTTFIIKITIDVEDIVHGDLHLTELSRGHSTIGQWGIILVGPWATITISITIVIAKKVITLLLLIVSNLKRLINSAKKVLNQIGNQINQTSKVILELCRRKTTHKVKSTIEFICHCLVLF